MFRHCYSFVLYGDVIKYAELLSEQLEYISLDDHLAAVVFYQEGDSINLLLSRGFNLKNNIFFVNVDNICTFDLPLNLIRYIPHKFVIAEYYSIRDADHTNIHCEISILDFFFNSKFLFYGVRYSSNQLDPISAGLFGYKSKAAHEIDSIIDIFKKLSFFKYIFKYRYDQVLLSLFLYPKIKSNLIIFTNCHLYYGENFFLTDTSRLNGFKD